MTSPRSLPQPRSGWALFLDVDGTLVEIAKKPGEAFVAPRMLAVVEALERATGGALALVSGRTLADLDRLFAPLRLAAAGVHGLERRDASGRVTRHARRDAALESVLAALQAFAAEHPGALIEDKTLTVALHYRGAPEAEADALRLAEGIAARHAGRLDLQRGKMVVEFRPPGPDKGAVVAAFMAEPPFAGRRPVFIGDDVTDEAGFAEVNRRGGYSIRVGAKAPTAARWRVATVEALTDWLAAVAERSDTGAEA